MHHHHYHQSVRFLRVESEAGNNVTTFRKKGSSFPKTNNSYGLAILRLVVMAEMLHVILHAMLHLVSGQPRSQGLSLLLNLGVGRERRGEKPWERSWCPGLPIIEESGNQNNYKCHWVLMSGRK